MQGTGSGMGKESFGGRNFPFQVGHTSLLSNVWSRELGAGVFRAAHKVHNTIAEYLKILCIQVHGETVGSNGIERP